MEIFGFTTFTDAEGKITLPPQIFHSLMSGQPIHITIHRPTGEEEIMESGRMIVEGELAPIPPHINHLINGL